MIYRVQGSKSEEEFASLEGSLTAVNVVSCHSGVYLIKEDAQEVVNKGSGDEELENFDKKNSEILGKWCKELMRKINILIGSRVNTIEGRTGSYVLGKSLKSTIGKLGRLTTLENRQEFPDYSTYFSSWYEEESITRPVCYLNLSEMVKGGNKKRKRFEILVNCNEDIKEGGYFLNPKYFGYEGLRNGSRCINVLGDTRNKKVLKRPVNSHLQPGEFVQNFKKVRSISSGKTLDRLNINLGEQKEARAGIISKSLEVLGFDFNGLMYHIAVKRHAVELLNPKFQTIKTIFKSDSPIVNLSTWVFGHSSNESFIMSLKTQKHTKKIIFNINNLLQNQF